VIEAIEVIEVRYLDLIHTVSDFQEDLSAFPYFFTPDCVLSSFTHIFSSNDPYQRIFSQLASCGRVWAKSWPFAPVELICRLCRALLCACVQLGRRISPNRPRDFLSNWLAFVNPQEMLSFQSRQTNRVRLSWPHAVCLADAFHFASLWSLLSLISFPMKCWVFYLVKPNGFCVGWLHRNLSVWQMHFIHTD
jgi:hypothetical protein